MAGFTAGNVQIAAGKCSRNDERTRLDAIGNDAVPGSAQLFHSLYANCGTARALNFGAHLVQQVG